MKTFKTDLIIVLACFLVLGFAGISTGQEIFVKDWAGTTQGAKFVPGEILVKFKPGVSDSIVAGINAQHGASVLSASRFAGFKRLKIPQGKTTTEMVEIYKRNPNVEYAEPNFIASAFMVPNDSYYYLQWNFDNGVYGGINMEAAWDNSSEGAGVIVAVVDTGVAYENYQETVWVGRRAKTKYYAQAPDLAGTNFVAGYDFVNNDTHPNDDEGHGTHVTGTIAQSTNNGVGVAGIAFNASIMPVKVLNSSGSGTYADIADGIIFAADNGAKIINMSLGGSSASTTLENALAYAYGKDVTIVCASGNDGSTTVVSYPAAYDAYCIAVGATRYDEAVAYYSNGGTSLDLTAPGGDTSVDQNGDGYVDGVLQQTFGTSPTDFGYWFYQGTSMATPHVSGVAALLIAKGVATTPDEVREVLQATAEDKGDAGWDPDYGWGIVDAAAALNYAQGVNMPPVADAGPDQTVQVGIPVSFDASGSYDDVGIVAYDWDFGDGTTGSGVSTVHAYEFEGTYTVILTVTDNGGLTSTDTASVTVTTAVPASGLHVEDITMALSARKAGKNTFTKALATVTVWDGSGNPVSGVTVYGSWSGATTDTDLGITDTGGAVTLESDEIRKAPAGTTFTFTVTGVEGQGWSYDPAQNTETSDSVIIE